MNYFVTGATGFIGRRLVEKLLQREGTVYFLILERELPLLDGLRQRWSADDNQVVPVVGDLTQPRLGVSDDELAMLRESGIQHMFHLAAIYDLKASAEVQLAVNVQGTRNAVEFAEAVEVGCFHLTSSIASAGLYDGVFREDMFEEAEGLEHPYFRTKHESEGIVRKECKRPWRVYRPGLVVGHSKTGEMDKVDGPYYFFKLIQKMRNTLPPWMPTIGLEGGRLNLVPVDFAVNAMDYIAHQEGHDGQCFHLTDPDPKRIGEMLSIFARAAHAPSMRLQLNARMFDFIPSMIKHSVATWSPIRQITERVLHGLGLPSSVLKFVNYPTRFDSRETQKILAGTDIKVPDLETYADKLWDYWERNLDPELRIDRSLSGQVKDKVVVLTGASYGIGRSTALKLGEAGAKLILVARSEEKLLDIQRQIEKNGGVGHIYSCDIANMAACDDLVRRVQEEHGAIDILINNAGRSIRRAIGNSFDRFHDYERTMQLNYFGSIRLTMGFLPGMVKKRRGHVINLSSIGVLGSTPRFSAYVASKAALETFSRCAGAEFSDYGIEFTVVNMPLVRTPMTAPTKIYQSVPTISAEEAAEMITNAVIYKPVRVTTALGLWAHLLAHIAPNLWEDIMNTAYHLFPESSAAQGKKGVEDEAEKRLTAEQKAFAELTRGIHW